MRISGIHEKNGQKLPLWIEAAIIVMLSRLVLFAVYWYWKTSTGNTEGFFTALYNWDCGWYESIVKNGYQTEQDIGGQANWAFFPLVPMLEGILSRLTALPPGIVGPWMNMLALYLITWWGACYIQRLDVGQKQAAAFMLLINFGPYNVYYSTMYTEAMFVLLVGLTLYCLQTEHWLLMGLFGALAGATRNTGIFLVFSVPVWCLLTYLGRKDIHHKRNVKDFILWVLQKPRLILGTFLMPMGFFLYVQHLNKLIGDGLAFMHVQFAWGKEVGNPVLNIWNGLMDIGTENFFQAVCTLICIYLLVHQALRRRPEAIITFLFIFIPLSTTVSGMTRYVLCSFPILLEAALVLSKKERLAKYFWGTFLFVFGLATSLKWFEAANIMM